MQILIPSNVSMVNEIILPVALFDILDAAWTTELVLDFDSDMHAK